MSYRGMTLTCRGCREPLVAVEVRGLPALGCPRCDGHWFEDATFAALVAACFHAAKLERLVEFEDGSEHHDCPVCGEELASTWLELLRFERCLGHAHGFWCERAQLAHLLDGRVTLEQPPPGPSGIKIGY